MTTDTTPTELDARLAEIAHHIAPSLVRIGTDHRGTGLVVGSDTVLTTSHHLRDRTTTVTFADGARVDAAVRAVDLDGDLVVLDAPTGDRPPVEWGDGAELAIGTSVAAAGIDPGIGPRLTFGRVSAVHQRFRGPHGRTIDGAVEHSAPVRRGGSGGPVVDLEGRVVGVSTHRLRGGLYLAQPADERLRGRIERLRSGDDVSRPRLGVTLAPADVAARLRRSVGLPERAGLLVREVDPDGPAARAGIAEGDLLVRAGEHDLTDGHALFAALDAAGEELTVGLVRGADELDVVVRFEAGTTAPTDD